MNFNLKRAQKGFKSNFISSRGSKFRSFKKHEKFKYQTKEEKRNKELEKDYKLQQEKLVNLNLINTRDTPFLKSL